MIAAGTGALRVGARVGTAHFGMGVVVKATKGGALVRLDNFGGVEVEVAAAELRALDAPATVAAESPDAPTIPVARLRGDIAARRAIEALRFGLVPQSAIEDLTLGFAELRDWTHANLPAALGDRPHVAAVTGPFGTGKSHTMAVIRYVAGREGYATARVEVDGQTISLARPQTFLRQLWGSLGAPDVSVTPVFDLYARAITAGHPAPAILTGDDDAPNLLDRVRQNYQVMADLHDRGQLDAHAYALDALLSSSTEFTATDVERQIGVRAKKRVGETHLRRMLGNSVADRAHDLVATLAGHATIAQLAGFRGLVVTIDEFEVEQIPSRANYARVKENLAMLTAYLRGETSHRAAPLGLFFATVGEDETGADAAVGPMLAATGGGSYRLEPWPPALRRELAERIGRLYTAAYALDAGFDPTLVDRVEAGLAHGSLDDSGLIRAFIKRYVAALDAGYGPPATTTQQP